MTTTTETAENNDKKKVTEKQLQPCHRPSNSSYRGNKHSAISKIVV